MSLLDTVLGALGQEQTRNISQQIGAEPSQTAAGIQAALPLLLSGLSHNASQPGGAQNLLGALQGHDGQSLDKLREGGQVDTQEGQKIVQHVFGGQTEQAAQAVSHSSGLDMSSATQLLSTLAPLVMGALGRHQSQGGLDANGLGSLLSGEAGGLAQKLPGMLGGLLGANQAGGTSGEADQAGALGGMLGGLLGGGDKSKP